MKGKWALLTIIATRGLSPINSNDYPVKLKAIFTFSGKQYDWINCCFGLKMIEDALVKQGLLIDDNPKYISSGEVVVQKGKENKIEIYILKQ